MNRRTSKKSNKQFISEKEVRQQNGVGNVENQAVKDSNNVCDSENQADLKEMKKNEIGRETSPDGSKDKLTEPKNENFEESKKEDREMTIPQEVIYIKVQEILRQQSTSSKSEDNKILLNDNIIQNHLESRESEKKSNSEKKNYIKLNLNNSEYFGFVKGEKKSGLVRITSQDEGIFLGEWENFSKKKGIYLFPGQKELFWGEWVNEAKTQGVYIWNKGDSEENVTLEAFIGEFRNGNISRGLHFSREYIGQNYDDYFYLGKFDHNGAKSDNNAICYNKATQNFFIGEIQSNEKVRGLSNIFVANKKSSIKIKIDSKNGNRFYENISSSDDEQKLKDSFTEFSKMVGDHLYEDLKSLFDSLRKEILEPRTEDNLCKDKLESLTFKFNENYTKKLFSCLRLNK